MTAVRADRLSELLREDELDALVVTNIVNVRYLTGFTGTHALCLVGPDLRTFFTDFRYEEQAERQVHDFERAEAGRDLLRDACQRLADIGARRVGFEDHHLTVHSHRRLRERLADDIEPVAAGELVERLREVKDQGEVRAVRAAADLATEVLEEMVAAGFRGRTERQVKGDLELAMRSRGGEPAFDTIVAAGRNSALPHATAGDERIGPDTLVVVDLGCLLDGYCSDCTRTFATGSLSDEATKVYETVLDAQAKALEAVERDAVCREVDGVARQVIDEAGYGERFGHGLGHGVGLEVHEGPRLTQSVDESERLSVCNVITVEPGVYLPGDIGVRIEDLVVVREDGPEVLTPFPKSLATVTA